MELKDTVKGFVVHGVHFSTTTGNQAVGDCPFCGKEQHFFVNMTNRLWDCKRCALKGNFEQFLEKISEANQGEMTEELWKALAANRKLPRSAFLKWEVGYDGKQYTIPVRGPQGNVQDLRRYTLGKKTMATTGAYLGLLGAHKMVLMPGTDVYICEGEWDTMALAWLFKKLDANSVAVGVPGASIFKNEWIELFSRRRVFLMHDNDVAGEQGKKLCYDKLKPVATSVKWLAWPADLPEGFDVRDLVALEAVKNAKPRYVLSHLKSLLVDPATGVAPASPTGTPGQKPPERRGTKKRPSAEEVAKAYGKWLHFQNDEALRVLFGSVYANKIQGDPLWMFMIAPPGGSKSELLMSLSSNPLVETTSSLTPHTLISGANFSGGVDPSLLPKLNERILIIKDFTTILTMHYTSRDEIFATLRDAYDGNTKKQFGTGIVRSYNSHFGVIAGVTPKIEEFGVMHQSLGERFLKYRIKTGQKTLSEADRIRKALKNINQESRMRAELCEIANSVLDATLPDTLPTIPDRILEWIVNLAQTTAMMRGVVDRDRYTQQVLYKPAIEVGTRLAKQLAKFSIGVALYLQRKEVDDEIYSLTRRVALDTAPDRVEEIIRQLWRGATDEHPSLRTADVSAKTRLPLPTVFRVLQDLELLRLVNRVGTGTKYEWQVHPKLGQLLVGGNVYGRRKEERAEQPG